jgi:hypothetical protein
MVDPLRLGRAPVAWLHRRYRRRVGYHAHPDNNRRSNLDHGVGCHDYGTNHHNDSDYVNDDSGDDSCAGSSLGFVGVGEWNVD